MDICDVDECSAQSTIPSIRLGDVMVAANLCQAPQDQTVVNKGGENAGFVRERHTTAVQAD
jgi:hypothetical protein